MGLIIWPFVLALSQVDGATGPQAEPAQESPMHAATGFLDRKIELGGESYAYSVYVPQEYSRKQAWPAILFLHGSGERGSDGLLQTEVGIGTAIRRHRDWCPAIVVMPQCRPGKAWTGEMAEMAMKCLDDVAGAYRVDPHRIYLTGLSLGGYGAWRIGSENAGRFAAVVPICGFVDRPDRPADPELLARTAEALRSTPIWCFHGVKDRAVSVERSREVLAALRKADSTAVYTEVPDGEHNVWDRAYSDRKLWEWLFSQRLGTTAKPPAPGG